MLSLLLFYLPNLSREIWISNRLLVLKTSQTLFVYRHFVLELLLCCTACYQSRYEDESVCTNEYNSILAPFQHTPSALPTLCIMKIKIASSPVNTIGIMKIKIASSQKMTASHFAISILEKTTCLSSNKLSVYFGVIYHMQSCKQVCLDKKRASVACIYLQVVKKTSTSFHWCWHRKVCFSKSNEFFPI